MKTKLQSVSVNTLFAAAVATFIQIAITVLGLLSTFFLMPFAGPFFEAKIKYAYMSSMINEMQMLPFVIFGIACMLVPLIIFILGYKNIDKRKNVKLWSILALIATFLIMHFGSYSSSLITILGLVGSISGLVYKDELKK